MDGSLIAFAQARVVGVESEFFESAAAVPYLHRALIASELYKLEKGDTVTLRTNYGSFVYTVKETISFNKKDGKYVGKDIDAPLDINLEDTKPK